MRMKVPLTPSLKPTYSEPWTTHEREERCLNTFHMHCLKTHTGHQLARQDPLQSARLPSVQCDLSQPKMDRTCTQHGKCKHPHVPWTVGCGAKRRAHLLIQRCLQSGCEALAHRPCRLGEHRTRQCCVGA